MILQPSEEADNQIVDGVRNFLFAAGTGGLDLASVNIARGREVGIPGYTEVYENIFGTEITSFADLGSTGLGLIEDRVVDLLADAYDTVDQIDLWVGGISESAAGPNQLLGPTLSFFVADQFSRSAAGDAAFYLEDDQLAHLQILDPDITETTLADLIRDNVSVADGYLVPDNAFITPFENEIRGTDANDYLSGTGVADLIDGAGGNDKIKGFGDDDILLGGTGDDYIRGGGGADIILGGDGDDRLKGNFGADTLAGGAGDDTLRGNLGADILDGQAGNDNLLGGFGIDTYVFASDLLNDGFFDTDRIVRFRANEILDFSDYVGAGGTVSFTRNSSNSLTIDLSGEDTVNVYGVNVALDAAESQLKALY